MKKCLGAILGVIGGVIAGATVTNKVNQNKISDELKKVDKFKGYYNMLLQWLDIKQEGKSLSEYFVNNNYKTIAIYGMGEMGRRLYDELKDSEIQIKYVIDKNSITAYSPVEVKELDDFDGDDNVEVDVVVVTATFAFNEIQKEVSEKITCPIISLEDVIYE